MTARQQWMVVAVVVSLMGAGAWSASFLLRDELQQVNVGSKAPPFSAVTLDNPPALRNRESYKGQVVLFNIWATWCLPCRTEMPSIEALYRDLGPKGLRVVAVSIDQPGKEQDIRAFVREYGLTFEILHDSSGTVQQRYRTSGVPESFVIGRDGRIYKKWLGEDNWNSDGNRRLFEQLLGNTPE